MKKLKQLLLFTNLYSIDGIHKDFAFIQITT